jgi:CheY-like chemotaxis protein
LDHPEDKLEILGIAHDIRQMLMVITGRCGLLLERGPGPELRRHLLAMEMAAGDAGAMLGRLPGMSGRPPAGEPAGLAAAAEAACGMILPPDGQPWGSSAGAGNTSDWVLAQEVPAGLWTSVPPQILREVLANLLLNALAVLPDGGRVALTGGAGPERVFMRVADSGPGVPADRRESIFEAGVSASGEAGRGLGLPGCRALLEDFGGGLRLLEDAGPGAVFELDLPRAAEPVPEAGPGSGAEPPPAVEPGEVLVVDDEPAVQEMMLDLLGELGWQPVIARDADQALAAFRPGRFPLGLVDQSLPGLSGLELASRLRQADPAVVLVLVTGWGNEDIMAQAPEHGFDFTAEKPLTVEKIRGIIAKAAALLAGRGPERE